MHTASKLPGRTVSAWLVALVAVWLGLGVRIVIALARSESLRGDLAIPVFAFFACSALLASRVYDRATTPRVER